MREKGKSGHHSAAVQRISDGKKKKGEGTIGPFGFVREKKRRTCAAGIYKESSPKRKRISRGGQKRVMLGGGEYPLPPKREKGKGKKKTSRGGRPLLCFPTD